MMGPKENEDEKQVKGKGKVNVKKIVAYSDVLLDAEMDCIRNRWGNVGAFLHDHQLRFYSQEGRQRSKAILRDQITEDLLKGRHHSALSEEQWVLPEGHFLDNMFAYDELKYIEKRWGDTELYAQHGT